MTVNRVVCLEASVPHLYPNFPWLTPLPPPLELNSGSPLRRLVLNQSVVQTITEVEYHCDVVLSLLGGHVRCWLGLSSTCSRAFLSFPSYLNVKIIYYALFSYRLVPQRETASCSRTQWCTGVLGQTSGKVPCWSPKGSSRKDSLKWQEIPCRSCEGIKQKIYRIQRNEFFKSLTE